MKTVTRKETKSAEDRAMKNRLLLAGTIVSAIALVGARVYADDASDIEGFYPDNAYVAYDDMSGDYPVVTAILSQPGVFGGHTYTGWSVLAQDQTGSLDLFISQRSLTTMTHNASASIAVGDALNVAGQWSPFHQIPELSFSSVPASNNYFTIVSHGNPRPTPPVFTVSQLNVNNISNHIEFAGYFLQIQNAILSGSTGSFQSTFPNYAQANIASESYTITDQTGSMTMFDWVRSYSVAGALGGIAVPYGPIDALGFVSYNPGGSAEVTLLPDFLIPEPSSFALVGMGMGSLAALVIRRHRSWERS
jgi:hypothetical protein